MVNGARKYRKLPVEIEAIMFIGGTDGNAQEVMAFMGVEAGPDSRTTDGTKAIVRHDRVSGPIGIEIATLEGTMFAGIGDYIIKGVKGEFYPCKADIFNATYEPVGDGWVMLQELPDVEFNNSTDPPQVRHITGRALTPFEIDLIMDAYYENKIANFQSRTSGNSPAISHSSNSA